MTLFAEAELVPEGLLAWIAVGMAAGWLVGRPATGQVQAPTGDIAAGLFGAVFAGFLFSQFASGPRLLLGSVLFAASGACLSVAGFRVAFRERSRK